MEEKRYFDSERLKKDLCEEVIADIRDDLDSATRQLLRDVKREQKVQAERASRTEKFYTIFLALVCIINIFLGGRLLLQQDKIKGLEAQVVHMKEDIDKITLRVENLKSVSVPKPTPTHDSTPAPTSIPTPYPTPTSVPMPKDSSLGINAGLNEDVVYPSTN